MTESVKDLSEQRVMDISASLDEPDWLRDRRLEAYKAFVDLPWPTARDEAWRYSNPKRFDLDRPVDLQVGEPITGNRGIISGVADHLAAHLHLVDGGVAHVEVGQRAQQAGVVVTDLSTAARDHAHLVEPNLGVGVGTDEKFDALNLAAFGASAFVHVPPEVELDEAIAVTVEVNGDKAYTPRVLIVADRHASVRVYVEHVGQGDATVVEAIEVVTGDGATAEVLTAQDWGAGVDEIATHRGVVGPSSSYTHLEVTFGGRNVYIRPDVRLDGRGGSADLLGVYFPSGEQRFEHRSLIHHTGPQTTSDYTYKGALQGTAKSTWYGNIRIEPEADGCAADETNRNLILSDGASADSLPFLEILTADVVRCGHHSSVGQVDELQLFYLESRGIPREEAVRMLLFGFFADVTERIDWPGISDAVLNEIEGEVRSGPTALMDPRRSRSGQQD